MTDYEYIIKQIKFFHYKGWEDGELRKCVDMLPNLSRQELVSLYRSKWTLNDKIIRETIFNLLFKDQIGKREVRIKEMDIDRLIEEFRDKKSGNVALIRKELRDRYKAGKDKQKIAILFEGGTKSDQQWIKARKREERYGKTENNYQWKKPWHK